MLTLFDCSGRVRGRKKEESTAVPTTDIKIRRDFSAAECAAGLLLDAQTLRNNIILPAAGGAD